MSRNNNIDSLIDAGLNRYSAGDLDGALVAWEQVLAIEPTNPQATSYLGYVRVNYEALLNAAVVKVTADPAPPFATFAMDDNPQYVIQTSELDSASVVTEPVRRAPSYDSFGDDWFFEDDVALGTLQRSRTQSLDLSSAALAELASLQFSLEDDEPGRSGDAVSFESLTTEYAASAHQVRSPAAAEGSGHAPNAGRITRTSRPPQLEVRVRSPSSSPPESQRSGQATLDPSRDMMAGNVSADAENSAIERALRELAPVRDDPTAATDDLISSLPVPRRVSAARGSIAPVASFERSLGQPGSLVDAAAKSADQRRHTATTRSPAMEPLDSAAGPAARAPRAVVIDDPISQRSPHSLVGSAGSTGASDLSPPSRPGTVLPGEREGLDLFEQRVEPPLIEDVLPDTPTGDLRLGARVSVDDDNVPTRQSARSIAAQAVSRARTGGSGNRDSSPPQPPRADPIDACAAQILDEVDADGGRTDEPKDDRIRRRISSLLSRASAWNKTEPEKAVCAVELALSEDPNSALAQKLVHRNREAIMAVFQNYLGDLQHKPHLDRPLHELATVPLTPRAAFLLSRIDGELTLDEILDVSGMPRLEAYRHLSQLFLRKILG